MSDPARCNSGIGIEGPKLEERTANHTRGHSADQTPSDSTPLLLDPGQELVPLLGGQFHEAQALFLK